MNGLQSSSVNKYMLTVDFGDKCRVTSVNYNLHALTIFKTS